MPLFRASKRRRFQDRRACGGCRTRRCARAANFQICADELGVWLSQPGGVMRIFKGLDKHLVVGELSLDGTIRPVRGALSAAVCLQGKER